MNGTRGHQAQNGNSLKMEDWTYSFSLGAQQTRTLRRPIWSPTLLVSITSNAKSGGKPFAHRERPSPVHKVTFNSLNKDGTEPKKTKQIWRVFSQSFSNEEGEGNEKTKKKRFNTRNIFVRVSHFVTNTTEIFLCIPHIAYRSRGTHSRKTSVLQEISLAFEKHTR